MQRAAVPCNTDRPGWKSTNAGGAPFRPGWPLSGWGTLTLRTGTPRRRGTWGRRGVLSCHVAPKISAPDTSGWLGTNMTEPRRARWGVGRSHAPPPPTEAVEVGQGNQWWPWWTGGRRPLAGIITGSHNDFSWVETGFASRDGESLKKWKNLDWRLKLQISVFPISMYLGKYGLTISHLFDGLDFFRHRVPLIRAIPRHSSFCGLV